MTERVTSQNGPATSRRLNQSEAKSKTRSAELRPAKGKAPRRPHNAREPEPFETLPELVERIGNETITVLRGDKTVRMSRKERSLRREVDAALKGKVRSLQHLLKLMARHPELVAPREVTCMFINGALAQV